MCNTITSASPSHNDCPGCFGGDSLLSDAVGWTALERLVLCDECRITVRGYIKEEANGPDDDGGPDGPPVEEDGEVPYYEDDWVDNNDLHGYMGEEGY